MTDAPRAVALPPRGAAIGLMVGDAVVGVAAVVAGAAAWRHARTGIWSLAFPGSGLIEWVAVASVLMVLALGLGFRRQGHYERSLTWSVEATQLLMGIGTGMIGANLLTLLATGGLMPLWVQLIWLACVPALLAERSMVRAIFRGTGLRDMPIRVAGSPEIGLDRAHPVRLAAKAAFDIVVSLLVLIALLPLLLVIACVVGADGGPVLFGHVRVGRNGRRFHCLKFRTMVVDSDRVLKELLETDPAAAAEWEQTRKLTKDPRVTAIGALLRRTSLDELPQLLNVLRGDMSLVGPRPIVDAEVGRYADDIAFYYVARPGMTGLWQVSGRSRTTYARRVQLDVSYVRNWSFLYDLAILAKTIPVVLLRRGAV